MGLKAVFQNHLFYFFLIQKDVVHCKLFQHTYYILLYLYLHALPIHSLLLFDPTSLQTVPISASMTFICRHMQITIHFLHSLALDFILSHTITLPLPLPLSLTVHVTQAGLKLCAASLRIFMTYIHVSISVYSTLDCTCERKCATFLSQSLPHVNILIFSLHTLSYECSNLILLS